MIHMSQIKVPVETVCREAPAEKIKHGILSEKEVAIVRKAAAKLLKISEKKIESFQIKRKSVDARKGKEISFIYQAELACPQEDKVIRQYRKNDIKKIEQKSEFPVIKVSDSDRKKKVFVVGSGPAGLFAALELAEAGMTPVVLERGKEVDLRQKKVEAFWAGEELDPECNVQFGEGGAGTFSDGKLNTLVKDKNGYNFKVLSTFVEHGAPEEILYLQKPHIGTDRLREVVKAIRHHICELGGEFRFDTKLTDIMIEENRLTKIITNHRDGKSETLDCDVLILATGHSARDTFQMLYERGVQMQAKSFAVGVRVEHPQELIGSSQYGEWYQKLPTADYKLTYTTKQGRGVYSFCMCPGGYVVNASSETGRLVVNGMSNYARDSRNANSAIVVTVSPEDYGGEGPLAGVAFQRKWEEAAYKQGQGKIPVQLLEDFQKNQTSTNFGAVLPEMKGMYQLADVRQILPEIIGDSISEGMNAFEQKIRGYSRGDALISGIESRTSSPVKIIRDDTLQSNIKGIYPCGEGAGYAGGITSAAMDGIRVTRQILLSD